MSCPTIKKAFEDSLNKTTINLTDEFLVYDQGTIYNVTYGTFVNNLGATGSIADGANGAGVSILTGIATSYTIRGIQGGNGINTSVSGGNVVLSQSIAAAGTSNDGLSIIKTASGDTIQYKRIKAGAGIRIDSVTDSLVITNEESGVSLNSVSVNELSDFPTAVGGVITLADDTLYQITSNISTSNRFVCGNNTVVCAADPRIVDLTYTGSGTMFTASNGAFEIKEIGINCPNGTLLDTTGATNNFLMRWVRFGNIKDFGNLSHPVVGIYDIFVAQHTGQGFTFGTGVDMRLAMNNCTVANTTSPTSVFMNLNGTTFDALTMDSITFLNSTTGQIFLKGLAAGGNITDGNIGVVRNVQINGNMTALDTITENDEGWDFANNNKIADTDPHAAFYMSAPATTAIATAGTPVQVNGTFTNKDLQVYSATAAGVATYNGERQKYARIDITCALEPASGTNKLLFVQIAKNGSVLPETKIVRNSSAGSPAVISIDWSERLSKTDTISIFVGNDTDTVDVAVNQLLVRVA